MTLTALKYSLIRSAFFPVLLLICGCAEQHTANTWVYSIEVSGLPDSEERVFILADSLYYSALLLDGSPVEQQFQEPKFVILQRESGAVWRCDYTQFHSELIDFLEWSYLADSVVDSGLTERISNRDLSFIELYFANPPKAIKVWYDPAQENVVADLPNVPGLPIIIEKELPNRTERWELVSLVYTPDSLIPKPQTANCFYQFPEAWLVHPTLGTPTVDNYSFNIQISAIDAVGFLQGAGVRVFRNDTLYTELEMEDTSGIAIFLPPKGSFRIEAFAKGYLSKSCRMDFNSIPDSAWVGGFHSDLDFTLFEPIPGFDVTLLDEPIGIAAYNDSLNAMEFDLEYTRERKRRIQESLANALKDS